MFSTASKSIAAYNKVHLENGVDVANPHRLILMLFDGAILSLSSAAQAMRSGNTAEKGKLISSTLDIISGGLQASLNLQIGGELSERLNGLYDYMCQRLLYANLHNNTAAIEEVSALLVELRSAWEEIANDPAVLQQNRGGQ
ncbi:MAG: flagellar export chaperone FliS [Rhodocyclaceae bacterium]|jgi:flagellar protein FliS|nr:flagellar export chaperone FliS [Rhodocyclaceae bacterium]